MEADKAITLGDWLDLRDDMRAAELLLDDLQFEPLHLTAYWAMSAELLSMLQDVDEHLERWRKHGPGEDERARYVGLRQRLVSVQARTEEVRRDGRED